MSLPPPRPRRRRWRPAAICVLVMLAFGGTAFLPCDPRLELQAVHRIEAVAPSGWRLVRIVENTMPSYQHTGERYLERDPARGGRLLVFVGPAADIRIVGATTNAREALMVWVMPRAYEDSPDPNFWLMSWAVPAQLGHSRCLSVYALPTRVTNGAQGFDVVDVNDEFYSEDSSTFGPWKDPPRAPITWKSYAGDIDRQFRSRGE